MATIKANAGAASVWEHPKGPRVVLCHVRAATTVAAYWHRQAKHARGIRRASR